MLYSSRHDWSATTGRHPRLRPGGRIVPAVAALALASTLFAAPGRAATEATEAAEGSNDLPSDLRPEWIGLPDLPQAPPAEPESPRESASGQALAALHQDSVSLAAPAVVQLAFHLPIAPDRLDAGAIGSGASLGLARGAERGGWGSSSGFGGGGIRLPAGGECSTPGPFGRGSLR